MSGRADPAAITPEAEPAILALNNAHATELSRLDPERLSRMVARAFHARQVGHGAAFMLAFDERPEYDSPNFLWFRERYRRFVYVDRLAVAPAARGQGHARRLYAGLIERAAAAGHDVIACEVNREPANPVSDALHASLGFEEVGQATTRDGKRVRYFTRPVSLAVSP